MAIPYIHPQCEHRYCATGGEPHEIHVPDHYAPPPYPYSHHGGEWVYRTPTEEHCRCICHAEFETNERDRLIIAYREPRYQDDLREMQPPVSEAEQSRVLNRWDLARYLSDEGHAHRWVLTTTELSNMLSITPQRVRVLARDRGLGKLVGGEWLFSADDRLAMQDRRPGRPTADQRQP